jgi:hypothetical protein
LGGFRFTFLRHFPRPEDSEALRGVAQLLYDLVLENPRVSSLPPEVEELSRYAGGLAYDLGEIADRLNQELAKWREV